MEKVVGRIVLPVVVRTQSPTVDPAKFGLDCAKAAVEGIIEGWLRRTLDGVSK